MQNRIMKNFIFLFIFIISNSLCFGQWRALNTGTNTTYYDLHCIDENIVFACGQNGRIIKTGNGGEEWRECFSMTSQVNLLKIVFADENTGYAGGENSATQKGVLLKTSDGGESWEMVNTGDSIPNIVDIFVIDADTLYLLQRYSGELLKSTDGGSNWQSVFTGDGYLMNFYFLGETGYLLQSDPGKLYKTDNYGRDWSLVRELSLARTFAIPYSSVDFCFNDPENGEIFGTRRHTSEDGFHTYHSELLHWGFVYPFGPIYAKVKYLDNGRGCGIGFYHINSNFEYKVLMTENGGNSWFPFNNGLSMSYYAVDGAGDSTFYIASDAGVIFKTIRAATIIEECPYGSAVEIYPNPAYDQITVTSEELEIQEIFISDMAGREVFRQTGINDSYITIYLTDWEAGMYIVKILTDRGFVSKKIIKQ